MTAYCIDRDFHMEITEVDDTHPPLTIRSDNTGITYTYRDHHRGVAVYEAIEGGRDVA